MVKCFVTTAYRSALTAGAAMFPLETLNAYVAGVCVYIIFMFLYLKAIAYDKILSDCSFSLRMGCMTSGTGLMIEHGKIV